MSWVGLEFAGAKLGDERLALRLMRMVESLSEHFEASIPQAFGSWAEVKAAYRFWENPRVAWQEILRPHREQTGCRAAEHSTVLVVQDTSEIDLTHHPSTEGLGYLASPWCRGLLLHTCLAISPAGVPLGVIDQQMWSRGDGEPGKRHARRQKDITDKESQRWIEGMRATEGALADHPQVVIVGDRESDIYDLFAAPRAANVQLLVRVCRENRRVAHPERYLNRALAAAPLQGQLEVEIPRKAGRPARRARLNVRWSTLTILPPRNHRRREQLLSLSLQFVLVEEEQPPAGQAPIRWLLVTTLPVTSLEEATQCVKWYLHRWLIERFHFTLKSGCRLEHQQFECLQNVQRAVATFSVVAWRVLWLTHEAREHPDMPCTTVLQTCEWQALHAAVHRRHPQPMPGQPPSLRETVRMIARLGGFLGRTRDGEPGVKTVWRGLSRLNDITTGWLLQRQRTLPITVPP